MLRNERIVIPACLRPRVLDIAMRDTKELLNASLDLGKKFGGQLSLETLNSSLSRVMLVKSQANLQLHLQSA